jgi:hypothetical protein
VEVIGACPVECARPKRERPGSGEPGLSVRSAADGGKCEIRTHEVVDG